MMCSTNVEGSAPSLARLDDDVSGEQKGLHPERLPSISASTRTYREVGQIFDLKGNIIAEVDC